MATRTRPVRDRTPTPNGSPLRPAPCPPAPPSRPSEPEPTVPTAAERFSAELGTFVHQSHVQALGATIAAAIVARLLGLGSEPGVFAPFLVAVTAMALVHGPGPATTTIVCSAIASYFWFLQPLSALAFDPGGLRWLALFRIAVFAASGAAITWIAERHRAKLEDFDRSRRQLRAFIASPDVGMQVVDHDGRVTWADETMHRLIGRDAGDYIGIPFASIHTDPRTAADVLARIRAGQPLENVPASLRRKDGSTLDVLLSANTLLGDGSAPGTGVLLAALPIEEPTAGTDVSKLLVACLAERRTRAAEARGGASDGPTAHSSSAS
jgi:PAS domain S-box-containing protein